ncbi:alpha/beta hydrolase fold domain-containing protein [Isoptericola aurantiacus]|uniref:alpha/beta hydrolase fold domain-containing protein n=1 Tax=Isoptericola aurantiacus TaxID=3377839 RepID=UPI003839E388
MDLAPTRADVAYASDSPSQRLDLWLPADATTGPELPAVLFVHGGGWYYGSRTMAAPKVAPLVEAGFVVASLDYRLSAEAPFPAAVDDVSAAVRFLRSVPEIDADRVVLWGESAGANIACVVGALAGRVAPWEVPDGGAPEDGEPAVTPRVAAVVDWYGPTDLALMDSHAEEIGCAPSSHSADDSPESRYLGSPLRTAPDLAAQAGPLVHLESAGEAPLPAFAIAHGTADCTVAPGQAQLLVDALERRGESPWVTWLDGAEHSDTRFDAELLAPTIDWLREVLARL